MYYVYLLKSRRKNWLYIGSTKNLRQRFLDHNQSRVRSTKALAPFELIYYESYQTYTLAREREIELKKHGQQKELLLKRLGLG